MVKKKTKTLRTYDQDGFQRRAACLCFRDESEQEVSFKKILLLKGKYTDTHCQKKNEQVERDSLEFSFFFFFF